MSRSNSGKWGDELSFLEDSKPRRDETMFSEIAQEQKENDYAWSLLEEDINAASFSGYAAFLPDRFMSSSEMLDLEGTIFLFENGSRGRAYPARTLSLKELEQIAHRIEGNNDIDNGVLTEPVCSINKDEGKLLYVSEEYSFQKAGFYPSPARAIWETVEHEKMVFDEALVVESDVEPSFSEREETLHIYLNGTEIKRYENVEEFETGSRDREHRISRYGYGINKE